jgi:hypothetical protein
MTELTSETLDVLASAPPLGARLAVIDDHLKEDESL